MAIRRRTETATPSHAIGPKTVPTASLQPNPHNPRYLFDEDPLTTLKDSIRKVGILVPLTVFKAAGSNKYTILDGQRRWISEKSRTGSHIAFFQQHTPVATSAFDRRWSWIRYDLHLTN